VFSIFYLVLSESLDVVYQRLLHVGTRNEYVFQLGSRKLQQHLETLGFCSLAALDKTFPHSFLLPHLKFKNQAVKQIQNSQNKHYLFLNEPLQDVHDEAYQSRIQSERLNYSSHEQSGQRTLFH
jgi:hypothetical protein